MQEGHYNFLDKLLHRMALQIPSLAELSFDINLRQNKSQLEDVSLRKHVFISGLARAGTTILMRQFYDTGLYRSLTYRDMPFILAPNLWQKITAGAHKSDTTHERMHGDGIKISAESPEAFEEVFWRIFTGSEYIKKDRLIPYRASSEIISKFRQYVALIIAAGRAGNRYYLSKNNNNILRLETIRKAFSEALILIPFRHPLAHANSLFNQHKLFIKLQKTDHFTRDYMDWLGHFEFGSGHKVFDFGNRTRATPDTGNLDYWLDLWIATYDGINKTAPEDVHFICYEDLCTKDEIWKKIASWAGLETVPIHNFILAEKEINADFDQDKLEKAIKLYERLRNKA